MAKSKPIPFKMLVAALLNDQEPFPPRYLHRFSDLLQRRQPIPGPGVAEDITRRAGLLCWKTWMSSTRRTTCYPSRKCASWRSRTRSRRCVCWQSRSCMSMNSPNSSPIFIRMAQHDADGEVRAAAASALGAFIYLGEVDKLHPSTLKRVEECLAEHSPRPG